MTHGQHSSPHCHLPYSATHILNAIKPTCRVCGATGISTSQSCFTNLQTSWQALQFIQQRQAKGKLPLTDFTADMVPPQLAALGRNVDGDKRGGQRQTQLLRLLQMQVCWWKNLTYECLTQEMLRHILPVSDRFTIKPTSCYGHCRPPGMKRSRLRSRRRRQSRPCCECCSMTILKRWVTCLVAWVYA